MEGAKTSILTEKLEKHVCYPEGTNSTYDTRIRKRTRKGLRDFRVLAEHLDPDERDKIFAEKPLSDEYWDLVDDISFAIEFFYLGLGGEHAFKQPLKAAVSRAEELMGSVENAIEIEPRFAVDPYGHQDIHDIVEAVEAREWDRLRAPSLFAFVKLASNQDAVNFETIKEYLDPPVGPDEITLRMNPPTHTLRVHRDTHRQLEAFRREGETVDAAIDRAIEAANNYTNS